MLFGDLAYRDVKSKMDAIGSYRGRTREFVLLSTGVLTQC